jgi:shikimate dehydrogenase
MISAKTSLYCLIGRPVAKSLSPAIHNAAFKKLGIDAVYLAFEVKEEELEKVIGGLRYMVKGFNVTIPYKIRVMDLLDRVDPVAKVVGAVNTVKVEEGELYGINTDWKAIRALLQDIDEVGPCIVVGAGGAARAALYALYDLGFKDITVMNRTLDRARALALQFENALGFRPKVAGLDPGLVKDVEVFINATPMGMYDEPEFLEKVVDRLGGATVVDMAYSRNGTFLERSVEEVISGLDVLVEQAAQALEFWTGLKAPRDAMKEALNR